MATTYEEALLKTSKDPVYFVDIYDTDGVTWLAGFQTGRVLASTRTRESGLKTPSGVSQKFQERDGVMTIGNIDLEIIDIDQEVTYLQALTAGFLNCKVVVWAGDWDIEESEYAPAWIGRIRASSVNESATGIVLSCYDNTGWYNEKILQDVKEKTYVATAMGTSDTQYLYVDDASQFPTAGHVLVDSEMIEYFNWSSGSPDSFYLWGDVGGPTGRGALCTDRIVAHPINRTVYRALLIEENPVDLVLQLLTTTAIGNNGPYDLWIADRGIGIPYGEIDVAQFEAQRDTYFPTAICRLVVTAQAREEGWYTAGHVINNWILGPVGAFIIQGWDGKLRLMVIHAKEESPSGAPLDDSVLRGRARYMKQQTIMYNGVQYDYNYNPGDDEYTELGEIYQTRAEELYGDVRPKQYETRAWHIDNGAARVFHDHLVRRWDNGLEPTGVVEARTIFKRANLDLGEQTTLKTGTLPKLNAPGWGIEGVVQPIDRQVNWPDSSIDWKALYLSEIKRLNRFETWTTLDADYEPCYYETDHSQGLGTDGYLVTDGYDFNYGYVHLELTSPVDSRSQTIRLNMNLWFAVHPFWSEVYKYDFTLEYTCDPSSQILHTYNVWFLVPLNEYWIKIDYWGHNDSTGNRLPIGNTVYFKRAQIRKLQYLES